MGIDRQEVRKEELYDTALWLIDELETLAPEILYDVEGASVSPLGFDETADELRDSYEFLSQRYDFVSYSPGKAKPVALSSLMRATARSIISTLPLLQCVASRP